MYEKIKIDQGLTKILVMKTYGDQDDMKGLSFTFKEQIDYGKISFIF